MMMRIIFLLALLCFVVLVSFTNNPLPETVKPREALSHFGFFEGNISNLFPAAGVVPYHLHTPLFSNYAEKARFIKLPEGKKATYQENEIFDLPIGTYLIKHFYYPLDFRDPMKGRKIIETRVMYKDETGWQTWPYIWNDAQTDAIYDPTGETVDVQYINAQGRKVNTHYLVPNKNQCKGCHLQNNAVVPIGIAARHLNTPIAADENKSINQLAYWKQEGILEKLPEGNLPANANWLDKTASINDRARAYLDINCGHCHRPDGPANTSGLFLHAQETNPTAFGILKTPVAAGRGSGGRQFDIVPGKPDASILLFRMQTNDPGIAMPEIGREQLHAEGIALMREWIRQIK